MSRGAGGSGSEPAPSGRRGGESPAALRGAAGTLHPSLVSSPAAAQRLQHPPGSAARPRPSDSSPGCPPPRRPPPNPQCPAAASQGGRCRGRAGWWAGAVGILCLAGPGPRSPFWVGAPRPRRLPPTKQSAAVPHTRTWIRSTWLYSFSGSASRLRRCPTSFTTTLLSCKEGGRRRRRALQGGRADQLYPMLLWLCERHATVHAGAGEHGEFRAGGKLAGAASEQRAEQAGRQGEQAIGNCGCRQGSPPPAGAGGGASDG